MKIAFWSEGKQAETTYHTALIACASALMFPVRGAVVSGGYSGKDLERNFPAGRKRSVLARNAGILAAAEEQEYFVSGGLDCLLGKKRQELTEQVIMENMRPVVKGRLYCLPGSRRREQDWWQEDPLFTGLKQVIDAVEQFFDVVFVDCGSREDDIAKSILEEADVCVLNMTQEEERIGDYFRNPPKWRGKTFFLIGNYFSDGLYTRRNLERLYRVDESLLGAVPYNPQMQAAGRMGRTNRRLKEYIGKNTHGKNVEFEQELARTARLILKLAGVIA